MFNPSDLEGDVDHSFFDSDPDDDRPGGRQVVRSEENVAEELPARSPGSAFMALLGREEGEGSASSTDDSRELRLRHPTSSEEISDQSIKKGRRVKRSKGSSSTSSHYSSMGGTRGRGRELSDIEPSRSSDMGLSLAEESDYTLGDEVSLTSSSYSHLRSVEADESSAKEQTLRESAPLSGHSGFLHPDGTHADEYSQTESFVPESLLEENVVYHWRGRPSRKNYTFNNNEVRRIDHENQRLLRVLSRISLAPGASVGQFTRIAKAGPPHIPHSAVNRLREQKRIDKDNQALLKRLEYVKSTPMLKRSNQLTDYQRQARYQDTPCPVCDNSNLAASSVGQSSMRASTSQLGTRATSGSSNATRSKMHPSARSPFCC
ncbi:cilia- and flagella-associated protein 97 [Dunckerocampus dactyliophorus]|uniref:cilia- and flagella-associated protein 97 n=1 Tax=Dunckerocampus dactyliophorus TaxID=161453 RepID=UPI002405F2C1|nr:cilia- and flagella-associated protein 97 [Dunckerocampus dactyliophorus]